MISFFRFTVVLYFFVVLFLGLFAITVNAKETIRWNYPNYPTPAAIPCYKLDPSLLKHKRFKKRICYLPYF